MERNEEDLSNIIRQHQKARQIPKESDAKALSALENLSSEDLLALPDLSKCNTHTKIITYDGLYLSAKIKYERLKTEESFRRITDEDFFKPFILKDKFYIIEDYISGLSRKDRSKFTKEVKMSLLEAISALGKEANQCRKYFVKQIKSPPPIFYYEKYEVERAVISQIIFETNEKKGPHRYSSLHKESINIESLIKTLSIVYPEVKLAKSLKPESLLFKDNYLLINYDSMDSDIWESMKVRLNKNFLKSFTNFADSEDNSLYAVEKIYKPKEKLKSIVLPDEEAENIKGLIKLYKNKKIKSLSFLFHGDSGTGKTSLSHAIAKEFGMKVAKISASGLKTCALPYVVSFLNKKYKDSDFMVLFDECESLWFRSFRYSFSGDNAERGDIKEVLEKINGVVAFTSNYEPPESFCRRVSYSLNLKKPTSKVRAKILKNEIKKFSKEMNFSFKVNEEQINTLACQYDLSGGFVHQALLLGAAQSSGAIEFDHLDQGFQAVNSQNKSSKKIKFPEIKLSDLVVNKKQAKDFNRIVNYTKSHLSNLSKDSLMPNGVTVLFEGPSGTGKTAMAEALAFDLGLKFRRVTPSTFLSSWVGQTEKLIKSVLEEAEEENYLLFLDEAEGMLSSRSSAVRSFEKTQIDEWLNQLEQFKGVFIAATNHKEMMDHAFARRFLFKMYFGLPNEEGRFNYLKEHLNEILEESLCKSLAQKFNLSFGELRNVLVQIKTYKNPDIPTIESIFEQQIYGRMESQNRRIGIY